VWWWVWTLPLILNGVLLVQCGGQVITDEGGEPLPADNGGATSANGGTGGEDCMPPSAPCGGAENLESYPRLRTACGLDTVNRRGTPVRICDHIK
jgi:hypothetical protein